MVTTEAKIRALRPASLSAQTLGDLRSFGALGALGALGAFGFLDSLLGFLSR